MTNAKSPLRGTNNCENVKLINYIDLKEKYDHADTKKNIEIIKDFIFDLLRSRVFLYQTIDTRLLSAELYETKSR